MGFGSGTWSIFKQSEAGLNSQFSFSLAVRLTKIKELSVQLVTHCLKEKWWIHAFHKGISTKWNANSLIQVWTWVNDSVFNDYNRYTKYASSSTWPSSSSCAISMNIPDLLSPPLPIVHCSRLVFGNTSRIGTELLYVETYDSMKKNRKNK